MICRCGYQNEPDDLYCAQCGRRLPKGKKGKKGWLIAAIVVLLLAAGAAAAWFLIPREAPEEEPEETQEQTQGQEENRDPEAVKPQDVTEPDEQTPPTDGWDQDRLHYYEDGEAVTGLQEIEGAYYYFAPETGEKQTGWVEIDEAWHFFTEEGPAPKEGWYSDDKGWFYLEETGKHRRESSFTDETGKQEFVLDDEGYLTRMEYSELTCIETNEEVDGKTRPALMIPATLTSCTELTFHQKKVGSLTAVESSIWEIWLRTDGEWIKIRETPLPGEEGSYTLTFTQPQTFDAICIFTSQDRRVSSTLTGVKLDY